VKTFVVEQGTPGFTATKMEGKYALRTVQNADLTFEDCRIPAENELEGGNSFKDVNRVLELTRGGVAWNAQRAPSALGRLRSGSDHTGRGMASRAGPAPTVAPLPVRPNAVAQPAQLGKAVSCCVESRGEFVGFRDHVATAGRGHHRGVTPERRGDALRRHARALPCWSRRRARR
jgi:hypothetical protein